jgi:hypothetical protein
VITTTWHTGVELGIHHHLSGSLAIGPALRQERYRQGKAEREPADHRRSREFYQGKCLADAAHGATGATPRCGLVGVLPRRSTGLWQSLGWFPAAPAG